VLIALSLRIYPPHKRKSPRIQQALLGLKPRMQNYQEEKISGGCNPELYLRPMENIFIFSLKHKKPRGILV
jgi:hypothetical protein